MKSAKGKYQIVVFIILSFLFVLLIKGYNKGKLNNSSHTFVTDVEQPIINLNGTWKFSMEPEKEFWKNNVSFEKWNDIQVPGECSMQGFPIKHDQPYVYKTNIKIPSDYKNKIVKLKFDGVYSYSRIWVNGNFIRDHKGGFTAWECDITNCIEPGKDAVVTVEITDKKDELSYGSGYAKHQIGGILRNVWLLALPKNYIEKLYVETDLDSYYQDAEIKVYIKTNLEKKSFIEFQLFDRNNLIVPLKNNVFEINNSGSELSLSIPNPIKWDAEHPNLYTLKTLQYDENNKLVFSKSQNIGFRKIEIAGNKMFVNGKQIKLRGACRHDIHPLLGRSTNSDFDLTDVKLAKEANINFIRTSHYPPSESFLNYCDQYGIYVEDESAICFVNTHRMNGYNELKQSGLEFEDQYMSQVKEMVHYHRNHPSVIIWSIGNESKYDVQIQKCYDYIKITDPSRPIIFSYPGMVPDSSKCYDILSMHYPSYKGDITPQYGIELTKFEYDKMPALFDEWAHVACYNQPTLRTDLNVREFWGRSLDSMWMNIFESDGGLGGAIWGYIDETFMMPENMVGFDDWWGFQEIKGEDKVYRGPTIGYGEWGIIDTWRRKKPEFWNTKKAYSPTKILINEVKEFSENSEILIPIQNRFDHTNFSEIKIVWKYENNSGEINNVDLAPHKKGKLIIPANNWDRNKFLTIQFFSKDNSLIDEYNLRLGSRLKENCELKKGKIEIAENNDNILFKGNKYSAILNLKTGLFENIISNEDTLIKSGPYLNILVFDKGDWATIPFYNKANNWKLNNVNYAEENGIVNIKTNGYYENNISVDYNMQIDENGLLEVEYNVFNLPKDKFIREAGIKFYLGKNFVDMNWDRNSYWNAYPDNHIGAPKGNININDIKITEYRKSPNHIWENDANDFYYQGLKFKYPLNKSSLSTRENIYSFGLKTNNNASIIVKDNGKKACRIEKPNDNLVLNINDLWDYASLKWGNYQKDIKFENQYSGKVKILIQ